MLNKVLVLFLILLLTPFIAGIYGILHDQITYSIAPEYYTQFKLYQFGLVEEGLTAPVEQQRLLVAIVGFLASWWMGIPIGLILGVVCLLQHPTAKQMFRVAMQSIWVVMLVALATGLLGLAYGYLADIGQQWWFPENLKYKKDFIAVGSMHNFSYLGGFLGLVAALFSSSYRKRRPAQ